MSNTPLSDDEINELRELLQTLQIEHRDLDQVISRLGESPQQFDELLLRRLKKRKLALRDRILILEQTLVPDIPA